MNNTRSLADRMRALFRGVRANKSPNIKLSAKDRLRLSGKSLGVSCVNRSFSLELGKQTLHLCPDLPLVTTEDETPPDFLVYDPERFHEKIGHSLRLKPGSTISVDYRQAQQNLLFSHPKDAFRRHLQVGHEGTALVFRDPISELGTYLSLLDEEQGGIRLRNERRDRLERIRELYGQNFEPLEPESALTLLREVNHLMREDPFRVTDSEGNPGSLVELPAELTPIIIGDLHAQVDNLLTILTENAFLDALERGEAALVFLGDAVHSERAGMLDQMDDSVLVMDLILTLKRCFPKRVFFFIGNHDSFSPEVMKGGVPQSVLWQKKLRACRGEDYANEMALFYQLSPLIVVTADFMACHASPPRTAISRETLINARQFPDLVHELTWGRLKTPSWPVGYSRGHVKRFRKSLGIEESRPFIVAHYPQSANSTLWLNAGEIPNHHIVFSARPDRVALFTRIDGELLSQIYPVKRLRDTPLPEADQAI